ncbi:hypothetical protein A3K55_00600 [Candidatus Shapirobacteria bacterium RBG_13_44_7]|uniref:DUF3048 domain-containing protein n=1 Tax=Candidatus Shapirobacteria bacterium RBG_13_44_7 TaxID=1802149 RepID=A0A1F7SGC8_9BACT|nr:MAG: hypothetical protein A3K55_00600 [Candidatus Shapirobacteria bacterium RBG_13_44_7]
MNPKIIPIVRFFGLFLLIAGISYFLFDRLIPARKPLISINLTSKTTPTPTTSKKTGVLNFEGPKTETCPLTGELYTKAEKDLWSIKRPLTVVIENHADSRPQSGLQNADIVYEAVAEGGITRFLAVYYCAAQKGAPNRYDVGPVRSARTYFLDLAAEYSDYPLYTHVGGANCSAATPGGPCTTNRKAQAIEQIASYGWNNKGTWSDLSQFSLSYKVCRREPERTGEVRDTEHTMYCSTAELWQTAASRGLTNITEINKSSWDKNFRSWNFKQKDESVSPVVANTISFDFWPGYQDYAVTWTYNSSANNYLRQNGGKNLIDFNDDQTLSAKNLIIQFVKESRSIDEHGHNLYEVVGSGSGILFQNGNKLDITWSKLGRTSRTVFKNASGKEINFVPGNVWIEILPKNNTISYENPKQS